MGPQNKPIWWNFHWNGKRLPHRTVGDTRKFFFVLFGGKYSSKSVQLNRLIWKTKSVAIRIQVELNVLWFILEFNDIHVAFHTVQEKLYYPQYYIFYSASHKNQHSIQKKKRSERKYWREEKKHAHTNQMFKCHYI